MTEPVLVRRPTQAFRPPPLAVGGRSVEPYLLVEPDDGFSLSYTVDAADLTFALDIFLRPELTGEVARFVADPEVQFDSMAEAMAGWAQEVTGEVATVAGLTAILIRARVDDRTEADMEIASNGLVFGVHATSTDPGLTDIAIRFAETRILPFFLDTP
jgi:hypothetical protein